MLSEKCLNTVFNKWKHYIKKDIQQKNIPRAIKSLSILSDLKFRFRSEYYDQDIENFIGTLSNQIFPTPSNYSAKENHVVMTDSSAWDYHALSIHYTRALMSMGLNILYVIIPSVMTKPDQILRELKEYGKAQIYIFGQNGKDILEQIVDLHHTIVSFQPANIFTHSFSVIDAIVLKALHVPVKYQISFADIDYWCSTSSTDYLIEFYNWGATLSCKYRGVPKDKILMQPYYPIELSAPFCGLPVVDENKVVIFSGGTSNKIKDQESTFFKLVLRLLDENPLAVVFYADRDNAPFIKEFIEKNKLQSRFFLIGYRSDLKSVFERIDIYLDTYPVGGGLMVQYAAVNRRPVLNLKSPATLLDYFEYDDNGIRYCSEYENIDDLCREAKILIENESHRKNVGSILEKKIISETEFNHAISRIITDKKTDYNFTEISFDYESFRKNLHKQLFYKRQIRSLVGNLYSHYSYKYLIKFPYIIVFYGTFLKILKKFEELTSPKTVRNK